MAGEGGMSPEIANAENSRLWSKFQNLFSNKKNAFGKEIMKRSEKKKFSQEKSISYIEFHFDVGSSGESTEISFYRNFQSDTYSYPEGQDAFKKLIGKQCFEIDPVARTDRRFRNARFGLLPSGVFTDKMGRQFWIHERYFLSEGDLVISQGFHGGDVHDEEEKEYAFHLEEVVPVDKYDNVAYVRRAEIGDYEYLFSIAKAIENGDFRLVDLSLISIPEKPKKS